MLRATNRPVLAFFDAIKNLRLRQVSLILKAGYDPNLMVNARGQNGLQYMINYFGATDAHFRLQAPINKAAYLSIAKLLLDSGLDPNAIDLLSGETTIFDAIRFNDKDMVSLLLNYADFALRNKNGETALMCAARFGSKQVMRMLLEHLHHLEMDVYFLRQRNRFGLTPLELARAENIECAKVLAKHLITYDRHPNAVLSRSSSHHQLLAAARPIPYHLRGASTRAPVAAAAALYDELATSDDYEDDVLAPPYLRAAAGLGYPGPRPSRYSRAAAAAAATGFYDPKAAEFNQYLLDQQEDLSAEQMGGSGGGGSGAMGQATSDDEEYLGGGGVGGGSCSAGRLIRSRSCMLGPGAQGGTKGYGKQGAGSGKKSGEAGTKGMSGSGGGGTSWADNGGAASGGRGTIG